MLNNRPHPTSPATVERDIDVVAERSWGPAGPHTGCILHKFQYSDPENGLASHLSIEVRLTFSCRPASIWTLLHAERRTMSGWKLIDPSEWLYEWCQERFETDAAL